MPARDDFNDAADEWFELEPGSFPAVPRPDAQGLFAVRAPISLPARDTAGARKYGDALAAALLILSQSKTGRDLATMAAEAGYCLCIDPPALSSAGAEYESGSFGNTDHTARCINLRGTEDPQRLALVIAHELTHVSQFVRGGLDIHVSRLHPLAAIRQLLAMEGDARAHEFRVAVELSRALKDEPAERLVFPELLDIAAETIGASMTKRVIELAKPALEGGAAPDEWMARIFKSFYASPALREHYESAVLHSLENFVSENPGCLGDPALFQDDLPRAELLTRLDGHCHSYLRACGEKYIDLDQPQMCAVSERTRQRLANLETLRHANPETLRDKSWLAPVYQLLPAARPAPMPPAPKP